MAWPDSKKRIARPVKLQPEAMRWMQSQYAWFGEKYY